MSKANKEGWIRHRGGRCPVDAGTLVDVRYRDGRINLAVPALTGGRGSLDMSAVNWNHSSSISNIMAYRLHKPAEQVASEQVMRDCVEKCASTESVSQMLYDPIAQGPLQWRDRITIIDFDIHSLTTERAELVQKLASEGFALI